MQLRQLGLSDLKITPVVFGAWAVGGWAWGGAVEQDSIAAIQASIDAGVNLIDTAAIYGMGFSEEIVRKALEGRRGKAMIATKCGMRWDAPGGTFAWNDKKNDGTPVAIHKNSTPTSIMHECEQSLRRLGVDVIDLYQIHWPDVSTPVEESVGAMVKLKEQGKIRAIGVSNFDADLMQRAQAIAPLASLQPPYSLIQRQIEEKLVPFCQKNNIGIIVYSPMERGLLTGKVSADRTFPPGDHRNTHPFFTVENRKRILSSLEKIKPIAERHRISLAQLVIAWTFHQPGITAAIVGARNAQQATHNAQAMQVSLNPQELADIRAAFDETSRALTQK